jgi:multidrug resistance efflux pump
MKKLVLFLFIAIFTLNIYAAKNRVVKIQSMIQGRVITCVEPGERVVKGQPLFYVDTTTLEIQKMKNIDTVEYNYSIVERYKKLAKTHNVKIADLQESKYNLVNAIQDVRNTQQSILNSYYFAPFDGIITNVVTYTGSAIDDGCEVVSLAEITPNTNIPEIEKSIKHTVQIGQIASTTSGIINMHVELGEQVKKGQLIFNVNTIPEVNDATTYIEPQRIKYNNALTYYKATYNRLEKLYNTKSISLADLQKADLDLKNAKNDLKAFAVNIKSSHYLAPFDGIVTKIVNYNGAIGDGGAIVQVTKAKTKTEAKQIEANLKATPVVAQVDSLIEGILRLNVHEKQKVKKGELLFHIDTASLENQKRKDRSNVKYCKQEYVRMDKLLKTHSVSKADYQTAKFNLINALADLKTTTLNLQNSCYYAPFDGIVTKIVTTDGSAVGDGSEVIDVTRASKA